MLKRLPCRLYFAPACRPQNGEHNHAEGVYLAEGWRGIHLWPVISRASWTADSFQPSSLKDKHAKKSSIKSCEDQFDPVTPKSNHFQISPATSSERLHHTEWRLPGKITYLIDLELADSLKKSHVRLGKTPDSLQEMLGLINQSAVEGKAVLPCWAAKESQCIPRAECGCSAECMKFKNINLTTVLQLRLFF